MTTEELISHIPFTVNTSEIRTKQQLAESLARHYAVLAAMAEDANNSELTQAFDTVRHLLPAFLDDTLTPQQKEENNQAMRTIADYLEKHSPEGREQQQQLRDDIHIACQEYNETVRLLRQKADRARALERLYRNTYNHPSGIMKEEFYIYGPDLC